MKAAEMALSGVKGFLDEPRTNAAGRIFKGRLTLPLVQWTGSGSDLIGTVTLSIEEIAAAAESRVLWTDQSVQRGIEPAAPPGTARELSLADGYPDPKLYIFDAANADDMVNKLLQGERVFFNPLVWNLRPNEFEAYWNADEDELYLYFGKIYLPDSHHRHQAVLRAARLFQERPSHYPRFDPTRQFKVEVYFLDREGEGNYFYDKNQRTKSVALSKAFDLTTQDDLSVLAKRVLDHSPKLDTGVNRVRDRLSKRANHWMTLSTLREIMRVFAGSTELDEAELEGLSIVAADFFDLMAAVRPEMRSETPHAVRENSLASSAVILQGLAPLMQQYNLDVANMGSDRARRVWAKRLEILSPEIVYKRKRFAGDFFSMDNPLWQENGIVRVNAETSRRTISNSGGSRTAAARALRDRLGVDKRPEAKKS